MRINKLAFSALAFATACSTAGTNTTPDTATPADLIEAARQAESRYGVPADLTLALAYVETGLRAPEAHEHVDSDELEALNHHPEVFSVGGIRPWLDLSPVELATGELGRSEEEIHSDAALGVTATALVLRQLADGPGEGTADLLSWVDALGDYAGLDEPAVRLAYADEVLGMLRRGFTAELADGSVIEVPAREVPYLTDDRADVSALAAGQYPGSLFVPAASGNYSTTRDGNSIQYIIIHTIEGSYSSGINTFRDPGAEVSAHYVVRSSDGEVTQMVNEAHTGWHSGNGTYNRRSIGIEHEGFINNPSRWYTDAMYRSSAALVRYLCDKYNIPKDRAHIIGHHEVPHPTIPGRFGGAGGHTDPGRGWDWNRFMELVRQGDTANVEALEVYWSRQTDGSYKLHALGGADVQRVEYFVDGNRIGDSSRSLGDNFPDTYTFSLEKNERLFEVKGYDSQNRMVASGVGLMDVTSGFEVFIRQVGRGKYDIGITRTPQEVGFIKVMVDGAFTLTNEITGTDRGEVEGTQHKVRYTFGTLGKRSVQIQTFNPDGSQRGTLHREFTFR